MLLPITITHFSGNSQILWGVNLNPLLLSQPHGLGQVSSVAAYGGVTGLDLQTSVYMPSLQL